MFLSHNARMTLRDRHSETVMFSPYLVNPSGASTNPAASRPETQSTDEQLKRGVDLEAA